MSAALDEALIAKLVHTFYARVREDAWLGPIFDARVENWDIHLSRMCAFWSSVTLGSGRYQGQPMRMHLPLPVDGRHFDRWLSRFEASAREVCPPEVAAIFLEKARRIAIARLLAEHGLGPRPPPPRRASPGQLRLVFADA